jgi:hypothetical protein
MKHYILCLVVVFLFSLESSAACFQDLSTHDTICDGPYIFKDNNKLRAKWIDNGYLKLDVITPGNFPEIKKEFNFTFDYKDLGNTYLVKPDFSQIYSDIDSISVISDLHGEYDSYLRLLKAVGIIDENLNWKYGKGHLVILGDTFDRGSKVTEIFWHLFGLEKQAEKAGGMVHVMLGNHELLVIGKDLTYINDKYRKVELISQIKYHDLYSANSVLGKWLRGKPIVVTINDILFVHAGISIDMVERRLKIEQINRGFSRMLAGKETQSDSEYEQLIFLNDDFGPVWYRGYFTELDFNENKTDSILNFYNKKHIVVGHTHCDGINPIFKNKIFGIDAGISNNESGEVLIYKEGIFYRGLTSGERLEL